MFFRSTGETVSSNLNIRKTRHDGSELKGLVGKLKKVLKNRLNDWTVIDEKAVQIDGKEAYIIAARFSIDQGGKELKLTNLQCYIHNGKSAFVLTYTTLPEHFEDARKAIEKSVMSSRID